MIAWITYGCAVLIISGVIGLHLGRFREAYTEMTGMMAGMTMGMLNGFLLGYAAAAAANSMLWGNLIGIILGLSLGAYFGRAGSLMGIMDGAMGGVMGGSMGAMLAVMLVFPREGQLWTAVLLALLYIAGMVGLVVLIERSAPQHAALHRLMPMFTRAVATEVAEETEARGHAASKRSATHVGAGTQSEKHTVNYYALLGVSKDATEDEISEAYLERIESVDEAEAERIERAVAVLTDAERRAAYDRKLINSQRAGATVVAANAAKVAKGKDVTANAKSTPGQQSRGPDGRRPTQAKQQASRAGGAVQVQKPRSARPVQKQGGGRGQLIGGGLAVLILLGLVGSWMFGQAAASGSRSGGNGSSGTGNPQAVNVPPELEARAVVAPVGADGKQTLDVAVNGDTRGYAPSVIKVKQGVPVHLNLKVEGSDPG